MAYSEAKLKSNGDDRVSPCFRPFWIGNASDMHLYRHYCRFDLNILINLSSFSGMPNSMTKLCNISLLSEPWAFLKSKKKQCIIVCASFPVYDNAKYLISGYLEIHTYVWYPIISSTCGVNLGRSLTFHRTITHYKISKNNDIFEWLLKGNLICMLCSFRFNIWQY
jgi:hypothetical protein